MSAVVHLKITDLFNTLKKNTNEETALAITRAFEQLQEEQELFAMQTKKEVREEISFRDLATKQDLELGLEKTKTSLIKWIIGLVFVPIIFAILSKHFGI